MTVKSGLRARALVTLMLVSVPAIATGKSSFRTSGFVSADCLAEAEPREPANIQLASSRALQAFLRGHPGYRLLEFNDIGDHGEFFQWCLHEPIEVDALKKRKEESLRPIVAADTTRDGKPDLVVVLVRTGKFSVVVFHGTTKGFGSRHFWVVRDDPEIIVGVYVSDAGAIVPLYCVACDSNPWYYWMGSYYEPMAHLPGETVCLEKGARAYSRPSLRSKAMGELERTMQAQIVRIGPRSARLGEGSEVVRWYHIKANDNPSLTGYVQSSRFLESPGSCD